ncbi:MAG: hypothetical protein J6Z16_03475 [Candidatus Methanomethylophilaceae archaeon]|nr:hypothetical protein [Candidatus Methanomethylophilaceae archaeon]
MPGEGRRRSSESLEAHGSRRYFAMGNALVCEAVGRLSDGIGRIINSELVPPNRF